jgi:hypothetical protein
MAKTKISEFSSTPANNTDIDSINIAEGCAPSNINDAIRELMAQLKDFQIGSQGDSFNGPIGTSTAAAGAFTTLSASSSVTLSGGTANGVTYLNGSKVLTSGTGLQFDGTNLLVGTTSALASGSGRGNITVNGSTDAILAFGIGAATAGYIYQGASSLIINTQGAKPITFESSGVERGRFSATGALVLQGGDTTANGIGITFPATQSASSNANTLDDYEEGTWTPNYSATGATITYAYRVGFYTKIGNKVFVELFLRTSSVSGGSGDVQITGLPFPIVTLSNAQSPQGGAVTFARNFASNFPSVVATDGASNATSLFLWYRTSANGALDTAMQASSLGTGSDGNWLVATLFYTTT